MHGRARRHFQTLTVLLILTGCDSLKPSIGTGPVRLGPAAMQAFVDYQAKSFPRHFALSEDGSAFYYTYCPSGRCRRTPQSQIIRLCETYSEGIPCKIYASSGKVVWIDES